MSNAFGRLFGTLGSGILYTFVGDDYGDVAGSDAIAGLAACFLAGTLSSLMAALITFKIDDNKGGLKCGSCCTIVAAAQEAMELKENVGSRPAEAGKSLQEKEKDLLQVDTSVQ